jgi:glycosyltransferase involved in cell wall biosynthesis
VRLTLVSRHLPEEQGTAAGRVLHATAQGLIAEGHDVAVRSWRPEPPTGALPGWCEWRPLPGEAGWRTRARALVRPRADAGRAEWTLPPDGIAIAEEPVSHAAVERGARHVTVVHYATALDVSATPDRRWRPADVQHVRGERRAVRRSDLLLTYSARVAEALGGRAIAIPIALHVPPRALPAVERPIAALVADWRWPPNRAALSHLLGVWPEVANAVPGAELHLAGRGEVGVGALAGVRVLGEVASSAAVLAEAAVLAFPCPETSGPKVKVLEAMASGLAVVTTPAGVEGLHVPPSAAAVADRAGFASALVGLLRDPAARAAAAAAAREAVAASHAPRSAARARVDALAGLDGDAGADG